jgi:RNA polymerase sigma factor (sigma-70 family)
MTNEEVEALLNQWRGYMHEIAYKWWRKNRRLEFEDLFAEVRFAFVKAARAYDPSRGLAFSTFATYCAGNWMQKVIRREAASGLHVPGHHRFQRIVPWSLEKPIPGTKAEMRRPLTGRDTLRAAEPEDRPEFPADFWDRIARLLPALQYEAVASYYRDGLSDQGTADRQGVSRTAVNERRKKAYKNIRRYLPELEAFLGRESA